MTWLRNSSYGRFDLQITPVEKFYRLPLNDTAYGIARDMPLATQAAYIREVVKLADADVDFSAYDFIFIVPTRNSRVALSPAFVDGTRSLVPADGGHVSHGVTFGMDMWSWGYKILVHEVIHTFGIPDLYLEPGDTHAAVRGWDLMGNIGGRGPELFAWNKLKLGWVDRLPDRLRDRAGHDRAHADRARDHGRHEGGGRADRAEHGLRDRVAPPAGRRRPGLQHRPADVLDQLAAALRPGADPDHRSLPRLSADLRLPRPGHRHAAAQRAAGADDA